MDSTRQQKVSRLIQKELGDIFLLESRKRYAGALITVTNVSISKDVALAKIYLSLYQTADKKQLLEHIEKDQREIRHNLAKRVKNQLRIIPELKFYLDDTLDYIEKIDKLLK